jgi:hypothetical protein
LIVGCLPHGVNVEVDQDASDYFKSRFWVALHPFFKLVNGGLRTCRLNRGSKSEFLLMETAALILLAQ